MIFINMASNIMKFNIFSRYVQIYALRLVLFLLKIISFFFLQPVAVPHRALGFGARRKKIYRGNIEPCINKTTIKKISRRAGVGRMGSLCNEEIRSALKVWIFK